jgi:hypothetical protein
LCPEFASVLIRISIYITFEGIFTPIVADFFMVCGSVAYTVKKIM